MNRHAQLQKNALSDRRDLGLHSLVRSILAQAHDLESIQFMLIQADLECVGPYLEVSQERFRQAFANVL